MDSSAVSFEPGDIVTIEDIGRNDAYFPSNHLLKGEILVIEEVKRYHCTDNGLYICALVSPLFPSYIRNMSLFISVKVNHLF
jgi:hypothetical protein